MNPFRHPVQWLNECNIRQADVQAYAVRRRQDRQLGESLAGMIEARAGRAHDPPCAYPCRACLGAEIGAVVREAVAAGSLAKSPARRASAAPGGHRRG